MIGAELRGLERPVECRQRQWRGMAALEGASKAHLVDSDCLTGNWQRRAQPATNAQSLGVSSPVRAGRARARSKRSC